MKASSTERSRRWRQSDENRARERLRQKETNAKNAPVRRAAARAWYVANRQRKLDAQRLRRAQHPEVARNAEWKRVLRSYGLTPADYQQMFDQQHGACSVCRRPPGPRRLHVDHDHATGRVRSLLCTRCNTALGLMDDDPGRARALASYLDKHRERKASP